MKRFTLIMSLFAACLLGNAASAEGYWGAKVLSVDIDASGYSNPINLGLFVGAEFGQLGSNIVSLEGEVTTSLIDGDTNVSGIDWSVQTFALYAAMRTGSDNYLKIKAGLLDREITLSTAGASVSGSDSGLSWGVGFGFNNYEIEYTFVDGDGSSDLSILSLGYMF